jgi:hypothetical protein
MNDTPRTDALMEHGPLQRPCLTELADFARKLERENTELIEALRDMVSVAESQGWDNAEFHNAQEALLKT